jgi:hypothetical protein
MAGIYGLLNLNDGERAYLSTIGQSVVLEAVNTYLAQINAEVDAAYGVFVEQDTEDHKQRYKLPGGGRMQASGFAPQGKPNAVKANGGWDVAFPLASFRDALGGDRISMAYMTSQDLQRHLDTIRVRYVNTVRFEILEALLNSAQDTFVDELWGSLSIEPLANGDTVVYPPVLGSETEATDNHYLESGYAASAISDSNNPYATVAAELEEHFGTPSGGANIISFINNAQTAKTRALTEFVDVTDLGVSPGATISTIVNSPRNIPGKLLGRCSDSGVWIAEWRWIPANYLVTVHLDAPAPLKRRVDPSYTNLPRGLTLVSTETEHPFETSIYDARFGMGVGNRLNGVVLELGTGGTYTVPAGY